MFYGIVGPGVTGVYSNWHTIEDIAACIPYCSYRKFYTKEQAWEFVKTHKRKNNSLSMHKYGDTFDEPYLTMSYLMWHDFAYFTYNIEHFGRIQLETPNDVLVRYGAKVITAKVSMKHNLKQNLIAHHLEVIAYGVGLLGDIIDVDIIVPNHSIYYALTIYTGENEEIINYRNKLKSRMGEFSITLAVKE